MWLWSKKTEIEVISLGPTNALRDNRVITLKNSTYTIKSSSTTTRPIMAKGRFADSQRVRPRSTRRRFLITMFTMMCMILCISFASLGLSLRFLFENEADSPAAVEGRLKNDTQLEQTSKTDNKTLNQFSSYPASSSGRLGPAPINAPDNSSLYLEERLALLEANITSLKVNITSLKERVISQETELGQLRNLTKGYQGQMKTLEDRLAEEERKSKNLNESVVALNNMQQVMRTTTSTVNITLSSSIDSLQKQTSSQETKITSADTHIKGNFTSLASMITAEATIRELNDSRLRSELASNAQQQADTMSSLSARLTALNETTRQGLSNVKTSVQSLTGNLTRSVVNLQLTDQNSLYQLASLRMNLSNQIRNISLTPGPQGPPGTNGVGNLTACSVQTTSGFASGTLAMVHYSVPSDQVVTGTYCYADKKEVYTEYNKSNIECKCSSVNTISGGFNCYIVVWLCPRIS